VHGRLRALDFQEERRLAGMVAGLLYLTASVSVAGVLVLPGAVTRHTEVVLATVAVGLAWGLICLFVIEWERAHPLVSHFSSAFGFVLVGVVMAATGGADSPARFYLYFIVFYCSYFYRPREAIPYLFGCAAVFSLPLFYDDSAVDSGLPGELIVAGATYVVLGVLIMLGKQLLVDLREQALDLSRHDSLTGIFNRRALMDLLERHVGGKRATDATGLLIVDLDNFKEANTRFGHPGGDEVLRQTAAVLEATARGDDLVARLGGDEFAIVARGVSAEVMATIAERVVSSLREKDAEMGLEGWHLSASVGWALYPDDAGTVDELFKAADDGLRGAKISGRDRAQAPTG
jgi:diguanylate cyclase (GGDEF)-like protein